MLSPSPKFAHGLTGIGLLAVRISGAASALVATLIFNLPFEFSLCTAAAGLALAAGLRTRSAALILAVCLLFVAYGLEAPLRVLLGLCAAHLASLGLTGPGAYSVDALLYGPVVIRVR